MDPLERIERKIDAIASYLLNGDKATLESDMKPLWRPTTRFHCGATIFDHAAHAVMDRRGGFQVCDGKPPGTRDAQR